MSLLYSNADVKHKVNLSKSPRLNLNDQFRAEYFQTQNTPIEDFNAYGYEGPIQVITNRVVNEQNSFRPDMLNNCQYIDLTLMTNDEDEATLNNDDDEDLMNMNIRDESEDEELESAFSFKTAQDDLNDYMSISEVDFDYSELNVNKIDTKQYEVLGYSSELIEELCGRLETSTSSDIIEANMFDCFQQKFTASNQAEERVEWREGNLKSAFNYLLIDPQLSDNLPKRAKYLNEKEVFRIFVSSIFYIGKGSRARPYAHLYDTLRHWKKKHNLMNDQVDQADSKPVKVRSYS